MKKHLLLLLCLLHLFTLAACQNNTSTGTENSIAPSTQSSMQTTGAAESTVTEATNAQPEPPTENTAPEENPQPQDPPQNNTQTPTQGDTGITTPPATDAIAQGQCAGEPTAATWVLSKDGTLTISGNTKPKSQLTQSRYSWDEYADQIKKIVVENGITQIPKYAFEQFYNLTEVVLADSVETICGNAFSNCTSLATITIPPKVTQLETSTFAGCTSLTSLNFAPQAQLHTINKQVFSASGLKEFIAPPSLRVIKSKAFDRLPALETVVLNDNLETVEGQAFNECRSLKKLVIGKGSLNIGPYSFNECVSISHYESYNSKNIPLSNLKFLKTVILGGEITNMPSLAFCQSIESLTFTGNPPVFENGSSASFGGITNLTVYYPANNPLWTEEVRKNYGAKQITWIAK